MAPHRSTKFCGPETASQEDTNFGNTVCLHFHPLQTLIFRHVDKSRYQVDDAMCICLDDALALPCFWCTSNKTRIGIVSVT